MIKPIKLFVMSEKEKREQVEKKLEKLGIKPVSVSMVQGATLPYTEIVFKDEADRNLYIRVYG